MPIRSSSASAATLSLIVSMATTRSWRETSMSSWNYRKGLPSSRVEPFVLRVTAGNHDRLRARAIAGPSAGNDDRLRARAIAGPSAGNDDRLRARAVAGPSAGNDDRLRARAVAGPSAGN